MAWPWPASWWPQAGGRGLGQGIRRFRRTGLMTRLLLPGWFDYISFHFVSFEMMK